MVAESSGVVLSVVLAGVLMLAGVLEMLAEVLAGVLVLAVLAAAVVVEVVERRWQASFHAGQEGEVTSCSSPQAGHDGFV